MVEAAGARGAKARVQPAVLPVVFRCSGAFSPNIPVRQKNDGNAAFKQTQGRSRRTIMTSGSKWRSQLRAKARCKDARSRPKPIMPKKNRGSLTGRPPKHEPLDLG
jgi:hypothetical protein